MKKKNGNLCLLVSYPKSGNTWFRSFYSNYVSNQSLPVSINQLLGGSVLNTRSYFDYYLGVESSNLTVDQVRQLRPSFYRALSDSLSLPLLIKHHDAFPEQEEMPLEAICSVIYLIRNPLDVAVSFAHHFERNIEKIIENMADDRYTLGKWSDKIFSSLEQKLSSWSNHVTGWTQAPLQQFHLIRYEDMVKDPKKAFGLALPFLDLAMDKARFGKALRFSSIGELKAQERKKTFLEKGPKGACFFREGAVGEGLKVLSKSQIQRIIQDHGSVMKRFGYLP